MTHNITVTKQEHSTVKIEGEIPFDELQKYRAAAIQKLSKGVAVKGFREGHVPEHILIQHVGEMALLGEMAERALARIYPDIVREHTLDVIGHPQVSITKLAQGNPLGFSAVVAVMPEVTLPDYKALAAQQHKESADVSEKDLTEAIENIQRQKIAYERLQNKAKKQTAEQPKGDDGVVDLPTPETVTKKEDVGDASADDADDTTLPVPELTDAYVQTLGDFSSVTDFKTKLREHLKTEKEQEMTQKHRAAITDAIVEGSTIDVPEVMIESEVGQMLAQMEADLKRANLTLTDYLEHIKKTKEDLVTEWRPNAEKRAKLQLVLNEIVKKENIEADSGRADQEVDQLLLQYKDADRERVRIYVETMLKNEAVMHMLENQS